MATKPGKTNATDMELLRVENEGQNVCFTSHTNTHTHAHTHTHMHTHLGKDSRGWLPLSIVLSRSTVQVTCSCSSKKGRWYLFVGQVYNTHVQDAVLCLVKE